MKNRWFMISILAIVFLGIGGIPSYGVNTEAVSAGHGDYNFLLWIAILLVIAAFGRLIEKIKQPSVLGELVAGLLLGVPLFVGFTYFENVKNSEFIKNVAELGVVILLFQTGLESNISEMQKNGVRALAVAAIGVAAPFSLGYFVSPLLIPNLSSHTALFLGATLTATSVGITARVFRDLGKLNTREAKIILGAAVFDDVIGLIILSVVSAIALNGSVEISDVGFVIAKAVGFLLIAVFLLRPLTHHISKMFSKINTGIGMKFVLAMSFCLVLAYAASLIGLAPIVGAFAAGIILEPVHFKFFKEPEIIEEIKRAVQGARTQINQRVSEVINRSSYTLGITSIEGMRSIASTAINQIDRISESVNKHSDRHVASLLEPIAYLTVPIFFVLTGMQVDLATLGNANVVVAAAGITFIAFTGKIVSGLVMWRSGIKSVAVVGFGMIPRGEVGLIFATIGKAIGVVSEEVFSIVIIMVMVSTLATPVILGFLLKDRGDNDHTLTQKTNEVM